MYYFTSRRQVRIDDGNQILHPDELEPGMRIGVVTIIDPIPYRQRSLQAQAALAFSYGREANERRLAAMKRGWQYKGSHGLLPDWRGTIQDVCDSGVWVDLAGSRREVDEPYQYLDKGVEALPSVTVPIRQYSTLESMGLAAVTAANVTFGTEAGRWLQAATVCLD